MHTEHMALTRNSTNKLRFFFSSFSDIETYYLVNKRERNQESLFVYLFLQIDNIKIPSITSHQTDLGRRICYYLFSPTINHNLSVSKSILVQLQKTWSLSVSINHYSPKWQQQPSIQKIINSFTYLYLVYHSQDVFFKLSAHFLDVEETSQMLVAKNRLSNLESNSQKVFSSKNNCS